MSEKIGNVIPPPLRFEMGADAEGEIVRSFLLLSADEGGAPRVAVLAPTEIKALDERRVEMRVLAATSTQRNLARGDVAALWCVLDGAAYTLRGRVEALPASTVAQHVSFILTLEDVLRDFYPSAPMIAGPTFRRTG